MRRPDRIAVSRRFEKLAFRERAAVIHALVIERPSEGFAGDPGDDRAGDRRRLRIGERIRNALGPNQNVALGVEQHRDIDKDEWHDGRGVALRKTNLNHRKRLPLPQDRLETHARHGLRPRDRG